MAAEEQKPQEERSEEEMPRGNLHQFIIEADVPEFFTDALNVSTGLYGTTIQFGTRSIPSLNKPAQILGILHMSPQLAKVFTTILIKQLRHYETSTGHISIPDALVEQIGTLKEIRLLEESNGD